MRREFRKGDRVRVARIPSDVLSKSPEESQAAFRLAVGKTFRVRGINEIGWLELDLGAKLDELPGTAGNTIWIEPDCVEAAKGPSGRGLRATPETD